MAQADRLHKLKRWLDAGSCPNRHYPLRELEVLSATLKRDLAFPRDRMDAQLVRDRARQGRRFDRRHPAIAPRHELPGLWFSDDEIHALLTMQCLVADLAAAELPGAHKHQPQHLRAVCGALLRSQRVVIACRGRDDAATSERKVSPQHLIRNRSNWHVHPWCHRRGRWDEARHWVVELRTPICAGS